MLVTLIKWIQLPTKISLPVAAIFMWCIRLMYFSAPPNFVSALVVSGFFEALTPLSIIFGAILLFQVCIACACVFSFWYMCPIAFVFRACACAVLFSFFVHVHVLLLRLFVLPALCMYQPVRPHAYSPPTNTLQTMHHTKCLP